VEQIKLIELRDFAIKHLPRARTLDRSLPYAQYQHTLYGFAALTPSTAPAIEQAAAHLLKTVLTLTIELEPDIEFGPQQRQAAEHEAVNAATELCALTESTIPWLTVDLDILEPTQTSEPAKDCPTPTSPPVRPALQPGPLQTTADAARYLGVAPQTMRVWASKDTGPLRHVKRGIFNAWPTEELIRLGQSGWKSRGSK
jgi:hypothetical protein